MECENIYKLSRNCEITTADARKEFRAFKSRFNFLKAAGGIVEYQGKFLFIERLGKWDLPKGKKEPNEKTKKTAIREIEEECNIHGHYIVYKICNTYHTYRHHDHYVLKKSSWFYLKVDHLNLDELKPQLEEGITQVRWFSLNEINLVRNNTFDSIHVVLDEFLKIYKVE